VDAIGEFQVLTNTYGAQYGGNGSVLNSVTRSGTNALHGSLYEFYRNSRFDEVQWPATRKQPFWKHQNGGTLGGPLRRNKMFFFGNIEYIRPERIAKPDQDRSQRAGAPGHHSTAGQRRSRRRLYRRVDCTTPELAAWAPRNQANFLRVKPYLDLYPLGPNQPGNVPA